MEEAQSSLKFGAFDLMLLGAFFISYNVLALIQVALLYGGRFIVFATVTLAAVLAAPGLEMLDLSETCAVRSSAILCGDGKQVLIGLGTVWPIVCFAVLLIFVMLRAIRRFRAGH
ncbi:MAG: hypothetical protein TEF_09310 [Rhizobiales bacterium NRL2]|jgi:hypothetical protein|nr:MAG: hypothetical protein TEF_09310 [Rhizobiales bacterium NRL2]